MAVRRRGLPEFVREPFPLPAQKLLEPKGYPPSIRVTAARPTNLTLHLSVRARRRLLRLVKAHAIP